VSPQSIRWLEEHHVWKAGGGRTDLRGMPAKMAEALLAIEFEMEKLSREERNAG
jgi:hypothetical protein